ncbi:MAG TPA: hypothetical protein VMD91_05095 [Candidatus Sulfotelmatobacter sp.]|nr:hypothetical protein [Candidatus Sulfotelmatobacter sp.]
MQQVRTAALAFVAITVLIVSGSQFGTSVGAAAPSASFRPGEGSKPSSCDKKYTGVIVPVILPLQLGGKVDGQFEASCNAYQEFTYLNWRSAGHGIPDPTVKGSAFGAPVDGAHTYATVWETYTNPDVLFATPTGLRNVKLSSNGLRTLSAISKGDGDDVHFSGFQQAGSFGWLTTRGGDLTFYEERIDNDEAQYITSNGLTSAAKQRTCAQSKYGLNLPAGASVDPAKPWTDHSCTGAAVTYGQNIGAIELKAAWIELHDPALYRKYLISRANLLYPDGTERKNVVIGLVGLHIIHKSPTTQQFLWATFEHVDNVPDATPYPEVPSTEAPATPTATPQWTYYNPNCAGPFCAVNKLPSPCPAPPIPGCQGYHVPTRTMRVVPRSSFAEAENTTFDEALTTAGAVNSVFRYYRLVDVQWPTQGTLVNPPGAPIPLSDGVALPRWIVANATMETYFQNVLACQSCHTGAAVSEGRPGGRVHINLVNPVLLRKLMHAKSGEPTEYASDYSFIFGKAK